MHPALARERRRTQQPDLALKLLTQAAKRFPGNAEIRLEFAQTLAGSGRLGPALKEFQAAVELQPAFGAAQQGLGCLRVRVGEFRRALEPLGAALKLQANPGRAHLCLGNAHLGLGDRDTALTHFEAALENDPLSPHALERIGDIHLLQGKLDHAIAHYRNALGQAPDLPASSQNLASALRRSCCWRQRHSSSWIIASWEHSIRGVIF